MTDNLRKAGFIPMARADGGASNTPQVAKTVFDLVEDLDGLTQNINEHLNTLANMVDDLGGQGRPDNPKEQPGSAVPTSASLRGRLTAAVRDLRSVRDRLEHVAIEGSVVVGQCSPPVDNMVRGR